MKAFYRKISLVLAAFVFISFSGCEENPTPEPTTGKVKIEFSVVNNGVPVNWYEIMSIDNNVNEFKMDQFKFYISNIKIKDAGGNLTSLADVILVDFSDPDKTSFSYTVPNGSYEGLQIGVGLDTALNSSDPLTFEVDEPLSSYQGMYWTWGTQYRFVLLDGRASKNGSINDPDKINVAYHPGASEFYSTMPLNKPFVLTGGNTETFKITIEMEDVFNGPGGIIDIAAEPQTHVVSPLAEKFMKNFAAALSAN